MTTGCARPIWGFETAYTRNHLLICRAALTSAHLLCVRINLAISNLIETIFNRRANWGLNMAKATQKKDNDDKASELIELGKMRKLTIQNFRAIGSHPVQVDLDRIVVLVGPNNVGKSSILRAYEVIMNHGAKEGELSIDDFPNGNIASGSPTIELEIEVSKIDESSILPAKKWVEEINGKSVVRERWIWPGVGKGKREGWNVEKTDWDDSAPWGAPNVAKARRPQPHSVKAFDPPEKQAEQINKIVIDTVREKAKSIPTADGSGETEYRLLLVRLKEFQQKVLEHTKLDISEIEDRLSEMIAGVFADHVVKLDVDYDYNEKSFTLFPSGSKLLVGSLPGYKSPLEMQGSGARRTMLWSVLRVISERKSTVTTRPNLLLIDEPELCLHPNAIREACRVLYDLADKAGWQVMVTTHSPAFIDLARDNTTVVRVERNDSGDIQGTTLFRPVDAALDAEDRENLKLMNLYDPYMAEFFFGGAIIVVEGDTEYAAIRHMIQDALEDENFTQISKSILRNVQIIRARGKAPILSIIKILSKFNSRYSILHDRDTETIEVTDKKTGQKKERANPAWAHNKSIHELALERGQGRVRIIQSEPNFEEAYLGKSASADKPYNAIKTLRENAEIKNKLRELLVALLDHKKTLPSGAKETLSPKL